MGLYILAFIIVLVIQVVLALKFSGYAEEKGYDAMPYFWACLLLGIVGYCMVASLPDLILHQKIASLNSPGIITTSNTASKFKPATTYTQKPDPISVKAIYQTWECQYCLTTNDKNQNSCKNCGKARSD